jgi:hypothetical protein
MIRLQRKIFLRAFVVLAFCVLVVPLFGQKDEELRLASSATVLQQILSEENGVPETVLDIGSEDICEPPKPNVSGGSK